MKFAYPRKEQRLGGCFGVSWNGVLGLWGLIVAWPIFGLMFEPVPVMAACLLAVVVTGAALLMSPWVRVSRQTRNRIDLASMLCWGVAAFVVTLAFAWPYTKTLFWIFVAALCFRHTALTLLRESILFRRRLCPCCRYL